ncbi:molybdopterin-guanine dinucleotide biosynthesis protein MobA [Alcanivorax xiamenensis]|uniref:Molybdenum cofactor guanylyltransferase n=1 Tax=Alcanivorax xiamenensis TaxID=1177156 RepID=A0ABQ6Y723_9GAMM|nr:molybdenum cofactor guanylyltransferase MobA [Alcanivorax xiamenensis]KAF0805214.1 molybdopterin-guanine dinucleotide biosynthesis protein MobA [Alcanivorax xiamenensis]
MEDVTVAILAGGQGRRLGGVDKGLIPVLGRSLVERVLQAVPAGTARLIVANRNLRAYQALGVPVVSDPWPDFRGPLAGILAALRTASTRWVLILPCDAVTLPDDLLPRLMIQAKLQGLRAAYAEAHGQGQYLCCLLNRDLESGLAEALELGERAPRHWFATIGAWPVDFSDVQPEPLWSLNNPAEVADACARLSRGD